MNAGLEIFKERKLLCRKATARYLGVAPQTLASWACSGRHRIPFVKIGRRTFYLREDLDAFIEQNRVV